MSNRQYDRAAAMERRWLQKSGHRIQSDVSSGTSQTVIGGAASAGRQVARAYRQRQALGREAVTGYKGTTLVAQADTHIAENRSVLPSEPMTQDGALRMGGRMKRRVQPKLSSASDSGRMMSKARRAALSRGKQGLVAQKNDSSGVANLMKMSNPTASGKDIAKEVRKERCKGKKNSGQQSSNESRRKAMHMKSGPEKVGVSETAQGQSVTGSLVGQAQATGTEAGICQRISGTEYMGTEEIATSCQDGKQPSIGTREVTRTARGQFVSGTTVGRSTKVSGDLAGQCVSVTGTEYLPAEQSEIFCGTQGKPRPDRRRVGSGKASSFMGEKVAGISPSSVKPREYSGPSKVITSTTIAGSRITGIQVGRVAQVTGDESGFCKNVTGDGYQGIEDRQQRCDTTLAAGKTKVLSSSTFSGQRITGDRAGLGDGITGAEVGTCQRVTGTPYVGAEASRDKCDPERAAAIERTVKLRYREGGFSVSGTQPGPAGLTGAQQGVCEPVTGTPYQGQDQMSAFCARSRAAEVGDVDFPQRLTTAITTAANQTSSLTGSFSQAVGKLTGDDMEVPRRGRAEPNPSAQAAASKVTGEGAQSGFSITGDAWDKGDRVTGTEGAWAHGRNPSMRGTPSTPLAAVNDYRPVTVPSVPDSPVSGSAGTTTAGAKVTVSGGARA